jgi:ribosome-binding protein aMBF1 (putative translation factor)
VIGGGFEVAGIVIETTDDIVQVIERERVRQGLSQRQLCAEAGLSHGA